LPVLIDIHGGGWMAGSKNARSIRAKAIMSQGIISVPIDYGLAPQYRMEEMIDHIRSALACTYGNNSQ
jgi:arylformamidase